MKIAEIRKKNEKDLRKLLAEKRQALQKFRFGKSGSNVKNVKEGRGTKREIARILTELRARQE